MDLLRPVTDGLAFLPYANAVHYDSEEQRRPLFQALIADQTLPSGYATDDGVGLLYRGTEFIEAVAETDGKTTYHVQRTGHGSTEDQTRCAPHLTAAHPRVRQASRLDTSRAGSRHALS
jgi:hypothetical protein